MATRWQDTYKKLFAEVDAAKERAKANFLASLRPANPPRLPEDQVIPLVDAITQAQWEALLAHIGPVSSDGSVEIDVAVNDDGVPQLDLRAVGGGGGGGGGSGLTTAVDIDFASWAASEGSIVIPDHVLGLDADHYTPLNKANFDKAAFTGISKDFRTYQEGGVGETLPFFPGLQLVGHGTGNDLWGDTADASAPYVAIPVLSLLPTATHALQDIGELWIWFKYWGPWDMYVSGGSRWNMHWDVGWYAGATCGLTTYPHNEGNFNRIAIVANNYGSTNGPPSRSDWLSGAVGAPGPMSSQKPMVARGSGRSLTYNNSPSGSTGEIDATDHDNVFAIRLLDLDRVQFYSGFVDDPVDSMHIGIVPSLDWPTRESLKLRGQATMTGTGLGRSGIIGLHDYQLCAFFGIHGGGGAYSAEIAATLRQLKVEYALADQSGGGGGGGGIATKLATTSTPVTVSGSAPPTTGQVLKAVDATHATWQNEAGGGGTVPTGTGWRHVTSGVEDGAASTPTAGDVGAVPTTRTVNSKALSADVSLTASDVGAVPTTRTVNGHALSADVLLTASDVGADASGSAATAAASALSTAESYTDAAIATRVPTTRTVNSKALSSDVTLSTADVADTTGKRYVTDAEKTALDNAGSANGVIKADGSNKIAVSQIPVGNVAGTVAAGNDARFAGIGVLPGPVILDFGGSDVNTSSTPRTTKQVFLNPSAWPAGSVWHLNATAYCPTANMTVVLYNVTDASVAATLTFTTSATPSSQSTAVTLPDGKIYELRFASVADGAVAYLGSANLEVSPT